MTNYKIFLDDVRKPEDVTWTQLPPGPWCIVRNYAEFVKTVLEKGLPSFIAFDHDLADEHYRPSMYNPDRHYTGYYTDGTFKEKTGHACAVWLCQYCAEKNLPVPEYAVHSKNPIGVENIVAFIESYKRFRETKCD